MGFHTAPVRCTEWLPGRGLLVTGSWDGTLRLWDPRQPGGQGLLAKIQLQVGAVWAVLCGSEDRLCMSQLALLGASVACKPACIPEAYSRHKAW